MLGTALHRQSRLSWPVVSERWKELVVSMPGNGKFPTSQRFERTRLIDLVQGFLDRRRIANRLCNSLLLRPPYLPRRLKSSG
jgi:hypothetical protein